MRSCVLRLSHRATARASTGPRTAHGSRSRRHRTAGRGTWVRGSSSIRPDGTGEKPVTDTRSESRSTPVRSRCRPTVRDRSSSERVSARNADVMNVDGRGADPSGERQRPIGPPTAHDRLRQVTRTFRPPSRAVAIRFVWQSWSIRADGSGLTRLQAGRTAASVRECGRTLWGSSDGAHRGSGPEPISDHRCRWVTGPAPSAVSPSRAAPSPGWPLRHASGGAAT